MSVRRTFLLGEIVRALETCLPGCRWELGPHNYRVYPSNGRPTCWFPSGAHGKRPGRAEIARKHVENLVAVFGVETCMRATLEGL